MVISLEIYFAYYSYKEFTILALESAVLVKKLIVNDANWFLSGSQLELQWTFSPSTRGHSGLLWLPAKSAFSLLVLTRASVSLSSNSSPLDSSLSPVNSLPTYCRQPTCPEKKCYTNVQCSSATARMNLLLLMANTYPLSNELSKT